MANFRCTQHIASVIIIILILISCAVMKNGPAKSPTQTPAQTSTQPITEAKHHMEAGNYRKALDDYKSEHQKHPHNQALAREYVKSIEDIKATAERISNAGDLTSACKIYNTLLKSFPDFKAFAHLLSFDKAHLNTEITECKASLSKQGFQEYRKGNLNEAIKLWQGYLAVDPNNPDIKRAVNTAKAQQKNLQQK
jgi:outer membrane protein assembly factor BamD (BamD/ComL family)